VGCLEGLKDEVLLGGARCDGLKEGEDASEPNIEGLRDVSGLPVGRIDGLKKGWLLGMDVGNTAGSTRRVLGAIGSLVAGARVLGPPENKEGKLGIAIGSALGASVGKRVGAFVGAMVGKSVGPIVGLLVGWLVGAFVGEGPIAAAASAKAFIAGVIQ
jgi:hypothetical protein